MTLENWQILFCSNHPFDQTANHKDPCTSFGIVKAAFCGQEFVVFSTVDSFLTQLQLATLSELQCNTALQRGDCFGQLTNVVGAAKLAHTTQKDLARSALTSASWCGRCCKLSCCPPASTHEISPKTPTDPSKMMPAARLKQVQPSVSGAFSKSNNDECSCCFMFQPALMRH